MSDLNSPLKPKHPSRAPETGKRNAQPVLRHWRLAAFLALGVAALNIVVMRQDMAPVMEAAIKLPDPVVTATVPSAPPAPVTETAAVVEEPEEDVDVMYGSGREGSLDDGGAVDALPGSTETRLSPNGPKIITFRDPSAVGVGQSVELAHLPEEDALEETAEGLLPVRTDDGRRPMDIYARPWSSVGGKRIAVVIGGLGLSQTGTQKAIQTLPEDITLGFAPQGASLSRWMREARKKGHELIVQLPMEPFGYPDIDPGPRTLRLASSAETNLENLHWALGRVTNYTGVMNYLGGRLATEEQALAPILGDLAYRGLLLLNDGTASSQLGAFAREKGVPYAQADVVIDQSRSREEIRAALTQLEALATRRGHAIGTGNAFDITIEEVANWANEAKKRGYEFVGVSAIVQTAGK